jgi:hypothetical protein
VIVILSAGAGMQGDSLPLFSSPPLFPSLPRFLPLRVVRLLSAMGRPMAVIRLLSFLCAATYNLG